MKRALLYFPILFLATGSFAAVALETPRLKPGLWEMHVQSSAGSANSLLPSTICVGAMSDQQRLVEQDNIKNRCSKYESREVGGNWVVDAVCSTRANTITKHVVTSLSGDRFREENTAPQGSMNSDGKWIGPCKPGQAPEIFK
jgi:hypothetical protein